MRVLTAGVGMVISSLAVVEYHLPSEMPPPDEIVTGELAPVASNSPKCPGTGP